MRLNDRHTNNTSSTSLRMALYCEDMITFYDDFYDDFAAAGQKWIFNGSYERERGFLWEGKMWGVALRHTQRKKDWINVTMTQVNAFWLKGTEFLIHKNRI